MSASSIQKPLQALGVTPWQVIVCIALGCFYLGEMRPKLEAGDKLSESVNKLSETVQVLTTKVEIHAVLLANMAEMKAEVRDLRLEIAKLHPKTAAN